MGDRTTNRAEIWGFLRPIFATKTTTEWIDLLDGCGVPAGPIYTMEEVFDDPQVQHLGMAQSVEHPVRGNVRLVAQPVDLSRTPASIVSATPDAGEHTDEILNEFGISADRIASLRSNGAI